MYLPEHLTELNMATYIQMKGGEGLETVDEFPTRKEAKENIAHYRFADRTNEYYLSSRACKEWRDSS